jgi:hypothetical protein
MFFYYFSESWLLYDDETAIDVMFPSLFEYEWKIDKFQVDF